jgi:2-haloacid dehalogenase
MATSAVEAVVFDLGNVMMQWDRELLYRHVIPDPQRREYFFAEIATMAWNHELDRGKPFDEGVAELSARHPEWADEIAAYRDRWAEMLGPADDGAVQLLDDILEAGVRAVGLTNFSAETFPIAEARFPFLQRFEGIVVSGREGVVKPDAEMFALVCDRYGLEPGAVLFTDDSLGNVEGARAAGWTAALWTGAAAFRAELIERGVLGS